MTMIKICGIQSVQDGLMVAQYGADALGLVFAPSKRQVTLEQGKKICQEMPEPIKKIGVFVNEEYEKVLEIAEECHLDYLQFHGSESPEYCSGFSNWKIIKALAIKDSVPKVSDYQVDAFLLDTYISGQVGGTGRTFDWNIAKSFPTGGVPLILAGGLTPENVVQAIKMVKPFGVDVSSGVETSGYKDSNKVKMFITEARRVNYEK